MEDELGLNDITGEDDIDAKNSDDLSDIEPVPNTATSRVEEPEFEETPIEEPESNEEGEGETPRRSGGRRVSNLRGRETASKEIPNGNRLAESKLQENINIDKLVAEIDDLDVEMQSMIGTDEGVKNYYADGYEHGIDMAKTIVREHNGSDDTDELLNDLEGKQSEIYSDIESDEDLYDCTDKDIDDICAGWVQAFDDVIELIKPKLQENKKLN